MLLYVLMLFGLPSPFASFLAHLVAIHFAFFVHFRWTFEGKVHSWWVALGKYLFVNFPLVFMTGSGAWLFASTGFSPIVVSILSGILCGVVSFGASKYFVFSLVEPKRKLPLEG